jgi:hypothetical protein
MCTYNSPERSCVGGTILMALGGELQIVAAPLIVASSSKEPEKLDAWGVLKKAAQRAGQGGLAGNL